MPENYLGKILQIHNIEEHSCRNALMKQKLKTKRAQFHVSSQRHWRSNFINVC